MKEKLKIGLIAVNSRTSHSNPTLFYAKQFLKKNSNAAPCLIELTINSNWREALDTMASMDCRYYLFSLYIWNRSFLEKLIPLLKNLKPDSTIILGGPEVTYNIDRWMDFSSADILVQGQIEGFLPYLLTCKKRLFQSPHTPINEVDFPYEEEDGEILAGRLIYYEASRGCLFNCSYCLSACEQGKPEYRRIDVVKEEMEQLISMKPKIVKMVDRTFNCDREYAREIWRFLIARQSPVPFHFEMHPLFLEDEDFEILSRAPHGLFYFEVGIQSTDRDVLKEVNRPWNREKEKANIDRLCSLTNIHTHLDQIVALPGDTRETAIRSFNEILSHGPDEFQLGFLKVLPGTPLEEESREHGIISAPFPPYEVVETRDFPFDDLSLFYRVEADLGRYYNSDYFPRTIHYLMHRFPSPWHFFQTLKNYSPENRLSKQWALLGESLLKLGTDSLEGEGDYLIDLLRLDWCPYATGQNYPPFLRLEIDETIKDLRREYYPYYEKKIEGFSRRNYNRSILFIPLSGTMKSEIKSDALLFYRDDNGGIQKHYLLDPA